MKRLRCSSLPRFYHLLPAFALAGGILFCAALTGEKQAAAQPSAPPARPADRPSDRPAERPAERPEGGTEIRPTRPDVYYLRDKDGKLVPVPDFSYEDFKRLYDLDRKLTDAAAPPKHVLSQLQVTGQIEGEQAVLQVQVRVTSKTDGWTSIPLRFSGAILRDQPRYDGPGTVLVEYHRERDGYVVWLQESDGQPHRITFEAAAPVKRNGASRRLAFSAPSTAVSELRLRVPGTRISATVSEGAGLLSSKAVDGQSSELVVAGIGGDFQLNWLDTPVDTTVIAPTLEATSAILVRVEGPRRLTSEARLKVRGYGVPLTSFRVKLPAGLEWFPLTEPGYRVNLVETLRPEGEAPTQVVEVTLDAKNSFFAEVRLRAVSPAREAALDERSETLGFDVQGAVRQFGQADFVVEGDWSVTWPRRENVQQVEVPDALRQQRVAARFEYFRQPCSLGVLVQPRRTRVTVEPEYTLRVGPQTMRLETVLRYRVRGPSADRVTVDLAGWKLDQLLPESLVDRELIREGPGGTTVLPLSADPTVAMQEFELRLELSRPTVTTDDVLSVPLPRPQADTFTPARLRVLPAENVSLSPRPRDMPGGVASLVQEPSAVGGAGPNALVFQLRGDVEQPRFAANYQLRARQVTVALDQQVQVEARRLLVEQRHTCRAAFEPMRYFRLQIPEPFGDAAFQAGLELPDGEIDALPVVSDPSSPAGQGEGDPTVRAVDLGQERTGTFVLVVRYSIPWDVAADESGATRVHVPLLLPVDDSTTRLAANRVRLVRDSQWQTDVNDSIWTPEFRSVEDGREAAFSAAGWIDDLPLEITSSRAQAGLGTVVRQAWVQSWFGRGWRQDRVVLRVQSSERRLLASLPPDIEKDDLLIAVNGRRVQPSVAADGTLIRIDWSPREAGAEQSVEFSYLAARGDDRYGRLRVVLPKIVGARGEQRWHWQLVLPPDEHLIEAPAGWVAQRRWSWQAGFLDQRMATTQSELERALQATAQTEPPADANQYLFSCFAPEATVEVRVADRTLLVLLASGLALALGLGALYAPLLRHPASLWAAGVAGIGVVLLAPSLAALILQAGLVGFVLALCGFLLRRLVRRRLGTRSVVRGVALSVGDKPLSDFRSGRSDSKHQATTATAPPMLGLLVAGAWAWGVGGDALAQSPGLPGPPSAAAKGADAKGASDVGKPTGEAEGRLPSFRRVLVREEQVPELARGHLPIARGEFDSLLDAVRKQLPRGAPATRIEQADYIVRWESPASLVGEARLRIAHSAAQPGFLQLDPCDLPVLDARWNPAAPGAEDAATDVAAARIGATAAGATGVIVDRAGVLHWRFTLQPERDSKGRFKVRLPRTARQRWWLELPDPLMPQFTDGVLIGPGAESLVRDAPESVRATAGRVWWCLEAGGRSELEWTTRSPAAGEPWTPAFTWRHETQYDLSLQGLEWRTTLRLDVTAAPLASLTCDIPRDVRIASVRLGDSPVPWTVRPSALEGRAELTLELPELHGSDRVLVLTALADPSLGARHTLPRLDCRGGFWLDGSATVTLAEPLQLRAFEVRGGRQTSVTSLATPQPAVALGVQFHDVESAIEIRADIPATQLRTLIGTSVDVDNSTVTARAEAAITAVRGRPFRIAAEVPTAWSVDSVEVQPESLLEDYSFEPAGAADRQRLVLRLRNPLTRERTLRLSVHAHRPRSADQDAVTVDVLRVLDFPAAEDESIETRRIVALSSKPDAPLEFRGDADVVWLSADQLAGPEAELLNVEAEYLFVDGREAAGLRGRVASAPAAYTAEVEVQVLALPGRLQERYRLVCAPRGAPVSRLIVLFSHARGEPLSWQVDEDEVNVPAARRLADRELAAVTRAAGEGWEVVLGAPRARPFVLWAERTSAWTERKPLALVSLPESETQQGVIRIEANGAAPIVSQQGLEAVPTSGEESVRRGDWLAAFRYAPANVPTVALTPAQRVEGAAAWAWSSELKTHYMADGRAFHRAVWRVETDGTRQIRARLPANVDEVQCTINGAPRSIVLEPDAEGALAPIALPAAVRQVVVELTFRTSERPLGWGRVLTPILVKLDIPEASRVWIPCVPANFRAWDDAAGWSAPRRTGRSGGTWWSFVSSRLTALFVDPDETRKTATTRETGPTNLEQSASVHLWTRYSLAAGERETTRLRVVNADLLQGLAWTIVLFVAGATAWPGGAVRAAPLALAALVASLPWLPTSWDPAPNGVFTGLVLGMAISWIRRARVAGIREAAAEGSTSGLRWAGTASLMLVALVGPILEFAPPLAAQEIADAGPYQVLYPVDEEGRPVDEYVHVPQAFYQDLRRRTRGQATALPGWMWRAARYRALVRDATPTSDEDRAGWEVASITALWDVEVYASDQRIVLPAHASWNTLLSQRIQREGQDVDLSLEWNGESWGVLLSEPGRYQLQAVWRPTLKLRAASDSASAGSLAGERWGVSQPIPRIADSRLTVEFPDGERWVETPGARGAVVRDVQARELRVELGPVDSLTMEGGAGATAVNLSTPVDVEQLVWFQLRPGAVTLDVVWNYSSVQGPLPRVARVTLDPRLRLLPTAPEQPVARMVSGEGGASVLQWEWDEATGSTGRVRFSFLAAGAMGVGQWRLPRMEPWNARISQKWMAVSSSANLETSRGGSASLQPIPPAEFVEAWGDAGALPQYAYRVSAVDQAWSLVTRLRAPRLLAAQTTQLGVDRDRTRLWWAADVEVSDGQVWSHTLEVPVNLAITDVVLLDRAGEENRLLQWSRIAPDQVQILLSAPLEGAHRVQLSGELPTPLDEPWSFPTLKLADAPLTSHRCVVYRAPTATVEWVTPPAAGTMQSTEEIRPGWGRRIADWSPPGPENLLQDAAAVLRVRENRPRVRGRMGTATSAARGEFRTDISGQLTIEAGVLDELRLETPADWPDELDIEPRWSASWSRMPKSDRKVLVLRPYQPWTDKVEFRIRGPVIAPRADRLPLPDLRMLDLDSAEYYLWLPRQSLDRPLTWDTSGLQATRWPEGLKFVGSSTPSEAGAEAGTAYRVVSSRTRVSLLDENVPRDRPRVSLADHRVFLDEFGAGWGISTLDVESAGEAECVLKLPERCELMQLHRDGRHTQRQPLGPRLWRVELAPADWAQRLEVVFRVAEEPATTPERARTAPAAMIVDWPASHWLLTVRALGDVDAGDGRLTDPDSIVLAQDVARLEAWSQSAEHAAEVLLSHPPRDAALWWPAWHMRFEQRARAILPTATRREDRERLADQSSQAARERMRQAATRLRIVPELEEEAPSERELGVEEGEVELAKWREESWEQAARAAPRVSELRWAFTHDPGPLVLRWRANGGQRERASWLWSGVWCGLGVAWGAFAWTGCVGLWWARWPQVVLTVAGLVCWIAAPWPFLGLALVAVGVLAALRGEWGYRVSSR